MWYSSPLLASEDMFLSLWSMLSLRKQVPDITFVVIEMIKPEFQGPDAVGKRWKELSLAWIEPGNTREADKGRKYR